ncbi:glutathione S-transferase family protein [Sandaracinobacteroides hominis]|uniref:glutathione S-transferase family protein n=1 Tax=Sandaracinobacteroides hominis TaxID=2780086 RepID=UPI0018F5AB93|nr:glutathione S-transferase family protein [Sandaracinobacteroides hominis]
MKFYNSVGPNPRVVKIFMAERGVAIPEVTIDLRGGENRRAPYNVSVNPTGQTPALELDDGSVLTEVTAICEYLDEVSPGPSLIGATPQERAETRMWTRRIDLRICEPMVNGFRFAEGLPLFEPRMRVLPEAAAGLKAIAQDGMNWLDPLIAGREFVAGGKLTLADILLFAFIDFGMGVGQPFDPACSNLKSWYERMKARPSTSPTA